MLKRNTLLAAMLMAATPLIPQNGIAQSTAAPAANPPTSTAPVGQFNGAVIAPGGAIGTTPGTGGSSIGTAAGVGSIGRPPESSSAGSSRTGDSSANPLPSDASRGVLGPAPASPGVVGGATTPPAGAPGPCVPGSMVNPC